MQTFFSVHFNQQIHVINSTLFICVASFALHKIYTDFRPENVLCQIFEEAV